MQLAGDIRSLFDQHRVQARPRREREHRARPAQQSSALVRALLGDLTPETRRELAEQLRPHLAEDAWLSVRSAAKYADCSVAALRYAMRCGEVEYGQRVAGGRVRFRRSAIDRWLSS